MAKFLQRNKEIKELEEKMQTLEVFNIPLNIDKNKIIGEGSSAIISKFCLQGKIGACKRFKETLPRKGILKAANRLVHLNHKNVVKFRGFSTRPSAFIMEYCSVDLAGN